MMSRVRVVAILLTVLTGFSGLVYQVTWQKCIATLLGSHSEATAAVLGIFLGGLSAGYALFGRVTARLVSQGRERGRPPRLLLLYGCVEAAIGVWALLFFEVFHALQLASLRLAPDAAGLAFAVDVGLTALLIGPPTLLMGGTIPVLTQALSESVHESTRVHAWVYGFNTAGAFLGALLAGFFLLPMLGIHTALIAMGAVNLVAGGIFIALGLRRASGNFAPPLAASPLRMEDFAVFAAAALLLGFAMMSLQTVLIRVGGLALGSSQFTFAMVVAVFVLCLALGGLAVSALRQVRAGYLVACTWLLAFCFFALYFQLPNFTYYAHVLRTLFGHEYTEFYTYYLTAFACLLLVLAVPLGLSGASLPLLFHVLRREVGDLGAVAGRLYSWNTVGNLLGALLGGYALLFWLDLHHVYRLAVGAVVVAAALLTVRLHGWNPLLGFAGLFAPAALLLAWLPAWQPLQLASGLFYHQMATPYSYAGPTRFFAQLPYRYPFYDDDPTTSVAVRESSYGERVNYTIVTDGKDDSSVLFEYDTTALSGIIPCLLAARCERVFVVGYGLGGTAGELAALDSVREVVVAEISQGVIEAAPFFDFANQNASQNPKIRIIRGDAYRTLLRSRTRWDVIVSEPSNPWASGIEMLYSREFLEAVKARLAPGGVYAQWIHNLPQMDAPTFELIIHTQTKVFDHSALWYMGRASDLSLLAFDRPSLDLAEIEERASRPEFRRGLAHANVRHFSDLLVHEALPVGVLNALRFEGPLHTLYHPRLSTSAARAFFHGRGNRIPFTGAGEAARMGAQNSLLQQYVATQGGSLSEVEMALAVSEACQRSMFEVCADLLALWKRNDSGSSLRLQVIEQLRKSLPKPVLQILAPDFQDRLAALYGDAAAPEHVSFEDAESAAKLYETFFFHGAPFDRTALTELRQACSDPRCQPPGATPPTP